MRVSNILCEYLNDPIGIGILHPRITWDLEDVKVQKEFEIKYSINGGEYVSKTVSSSSMHYVFKDEFAPRDLISYFIRIKDQDDNWSDYSPEHKFEFGLLGEPFKAKWISGNYHARKGVRYPVDCFIKQIKLQRVKKARLYITACGVYEARINGNRVGDYILAPGSTDYSKRINYQTYDVTSLLKEGVNEIEVLLGDGWYRGSIGAKGFTCVFGRETKLLAQLEITDEDGQISTISTDSSWKWANNGPIQFADLKDGEAVDNRNTTIYMDHAKEVKFNPNLTVSNNESVIESGRYKPTKMWKTPSGKMILEFPNNIAGYISFIINAHDGQTISLRMGEKIRDGELTLDNIQCKRKDILTPLQEVHFICKEGENVYTPHFYIAGFKYVEVVTDIAISKDDFTQISLNTRIEDTLSFECSNELINTFVDNTLRSLKSNSIDIPTDCPTRERMGWTGDSQVFFETASYLTNYAAFTRKHIVDVYDRQGKDGRLPQIAPYSAEDWFMGVMNGSVGWADVGILTPYRFYKKYGDIRLLEDNFENMERYAKFMIKRCGRTKGIYKIYAERLHLSKTNRKFQVNNGQSYGEWAEPSDVKAFVWTDFAKPNPEESMAYTAWMMSLMVEICDLLGRTENKALYEEYSEGVKRAYQELVTKENHSLDTNRQAKLVRPLYLHLLNEEQTAFAKERLIEALDFYKWRIGTGFLSTPFILYVLNDISPEYAYKLLENEEMPGWLYMAKNNTGTIWEDWEGPSGVQGGIASLNHYSKGAMVEWLISSMCGIKVVGENEFILCPTIGGHVDHAKAKYKSIYGTISLLWKKNDDGVVFDITVPANTKATFKYKNESKTLDSGTYRFEL